MPRRLCVPLAVIMVLAVMSFVDVGDSCNLGEKTEQASAQLWVLPPTNDPEVARVCATSLIVGQYLAFNDKPFSDHASFVRLVHDVKASLK